MNRTISAIAVVCWLFAMSWCRCGGGASGPSPEVRAEAEAVEGAALDHVADKEDVTKREVAMAEVPSPESGPEAVAETQVDMTRQDAMTETAELADGPAVETPIVDGQGEMTNELGIDHSGELEALDEENPDICVPACVEKACGVDGCGGSCGECADGEECDGGYCEKVCGQIEGKFAGEGGLAIWVEGSLAWLATAEPQGLHALDVSHPEEPLELGFWAGPVDATCGIHVSDGYAYVCTKSNDGSKMLGVIDVGDPSSPQLVGTYVLPAWNIGYPDSMFVEDKRLFFTIDDLPYGVLLVLDVSDPSTPTDLGQWTDELDDSCGHGELRDVEVVGDFAFVASFLRHFKGIPYGFSGLCIFDVSNAASPLLAASFATPAGATDVQVEDGKAFLATAEGLVIIDISDPVNPTPMGSAGLSAKTVFVDGDFAFVSGYSGACPCVLFASSCDNCYPGGIELIDVSDPMAPHPIAFQEIPAENWAAPFVSGGRAWLPGNTMDNASYSMLTWDFQPCLCAGCPEGTSCSQSVCLPASSQCNDGNFVQWDGCTAGVPSETQVPSPFDPWARRYSQPSVAALKDGGLAFMWLTTTWSWDGWAVPAANARLFPQKGLPADPDIELDWGGFYLVAGTVAAMESGFVATWFGHPTGEYGPMSRQFDFAGNNLGEEILVASDAGWSRPTAAGLANGEFVVAWLDGNSLLARTFTSDGVPDGSEFQLATAGVQELDDTRLAATLAPSPGGSFLAAWNSTGLDGDDDNTVRARVFDADGSPLGSEFPVNVWAEGAQRFPSATTLAGGGFAVAWESADQDGDGLGVFVRLFGDDGTPLTGDLQTSSVSAGHQRSPAVAGLTAGGFVVAWMGAGPSNSFGIFVRRFDKEGLPIGQESKAGAFDYPLTNGAYPSVDHTGDGGFVVVWQSNCASEIGTVGCVGRNVLAQRFDADGNKIYSLLE